MRIDNNISVTEREREYYKKFTSLNPSAEPLPQGDGVIRISPFDDYTIFTLFDETSENGELADKPIDLSNVGTLTLVFVGENDEIRIPNFTRVQEVDLSQGQVLFRIDKENSKKILSLDNNNFYITSRMEDESGVSDESVLYTGTFLSLTDSAKETMTSRLNDQALLYSQELAKLQTEIERLNLEISEMVSLNEEQVATIQALKASNLSLTNEVATLTDKLGTTEAETTLKEAEEAQKLADSTKRKREQVSLLNKKAKIQSSKAKQARYFKQAADNLQEFNTTNNPTSGDFRFIREKIEATDLND